MRLQDELVQLFGVADAATKKYILGQVPRLPVHFDSAELASLLDRGTADEDRVVAGRALSAWNRIGPELTLHAYGLDPGRAGLWSTVALKLGGGGATAGTADEAAPDAAAQRAGLAPVLEPCRAKLLELARVSGPIGELARQILGLVPFAGAEEALVEGAADPARAVGALIALTRRHRTLAAAQLAKLGRLPAWMRATIGGALGGREGREAALDAARSGDAEGALAAAAVLPELGAHWVDVGRALSGWSAGWVPAMLADGLGALPSAVAPPSGNVRATGKVPVPGSEKEPEPLRMLDALLKHASHDLGRILAVRAMGSYAFELSSRRAMKCLEKGSPHLQAAAIETLVKLDHRPAELPGLLAERVKSASLKLRGTAILGLMLFDRQPALRAAIELVSAGDATARVEGGYALGYLQSRTSLKLLATLARRDPFVPSALQAEKSLAHYTEEQVGAGLIELTQHRDPAVALNALAVLSHFAGEGAGGVLAAVEALEKRVAPEVARRALAEAGRLSGTVAGMDGYLARARTDEAARIGALEGLSRAGAVPAELARAAAGAGGALALAGAIAQLFAGDAAGAAGVARALDDPTTQAEALARLREVAVVAGEAGRGGRFLGLSKLVGAKRLPVKAEPLPLVVFQLAPVVVKEKDQDPLIKTLPDSPALLEQVNAVLGQLAREPAPKKAKAWPKELTYLHGPRGWRERVAPYKALAPAVLIVGAVVLFFVGDMARNVVAPAENVYVKRDAVLGKVGTKVDVTGRVTEVNPEKKQVVLVKDKTVTVRVWLPGIDLKGVKVGQVVAVSGLVKDVRANEIVVHGFAIKDS